MLFQLKLLWSFVMSFTYGCSFTLKYLFFSFKICICFKHVDWLHRVQHSRLAHTWSHLAAEQVSSSRKWRAAGSQYSYIPTGKGVKFHPRPFYRLTGNGHGGEKNVILQMLISFRGFIQLMGTINVEWVSLLLLKKGWTPGIICEWDVSPGATSTNMCVMEIINWQSKQQHLVLHYTIAHWSTISQTWVFLLLGFIWFRQWIRAEMVNQQKPMTRQLIVLLFISSN